jgi:hypothetical protein
MKRARGRGVSVDEKGDGERKIEMWKDGAGQEKEPDEKEEK